MKDLLGGDYWADIDKFAERDFGSNTQAYQNNLDYYNKYGHAHAAKVGDKYSYDYYAHVLSTRAWASYGFNVGGLGITVGGEVGYAKLWREGLWRKGLFPNNSKGDSRKLDYLTYKAKGNFSYRFSAAHAVEANVVYMQEAPEFQSSFVSPRTRNTTTPGLSAERVLGVDASYNLRYGDFKARISGYYTRIYDQSKVISYYDDVAATFTNFAMSGIDKVHFGLEAAVSIPIYHTLALNGAVSWGQYTYDSNPYYLQTQDNSGDIVSDGYVYWKDFRVESTPQTAVNVGLSVSRVGGAAQTKAMKKANANLRIELAQYKDMESFAQFSSDLDAETRHQLEHGKALTEMLKQPLYQPKTDAEQVVILVLASHGMLDEVPLAEQRARTAAFVRQFHADVSGTMDAITATGKLTPEQTDTILNAWKAYEGGESHGVQ